MRRIPLLALLAFSLLAPCAIANDEAAPSFWGGGATAQAGYAYEINYGAILSSISPGDGPGDGGGSTQGSSGGDTGQGLEVPRFDSSGKQACDIRVSPKAIDLYLDARYKEVRVENDERDRNVRLIYGFSSVEGSQDITNSLSIVDPVVDLVAGEGGEFTVKYTMSGDENWSEARAYLFVESEECKPVFVSITVHADDDPDSLSPESVIDKVSGMVEFSKEPVFGPTTNLGMKSKYFTIAALLGILLKIMLAALAQPISQDFRSRRFGLVLSWLALALIATGILGTVIIIVARSIGG